MADPAQIDQLAARQHGVFSLNQAREAGFDKNAVFRRVDSGSWRQMDSRVFGLRSAPATWERQMWVALLSRPAAVVGSRSAAFLHEFRRYPATKPTIVVPGSANARSPIARVVRAEHFDELEVVTVRGFPTTSINETLIQLAGELSSGAFVSLFDDLLLGRRLDLAHFNANLERNEGRRRRGIVIARKLVESRLPSAPTRTANYLEALLEKVLKRGDLPKWTREHPMSISGKPSRVDLFIEDWRIVVEADGRNWHMRNEAFEADRLRDNQLATMGIQVLRFTFKMLREDPDGCVTTIARAGRFRRAQGFDHRNPLL